MLPVPIIDFNLAEGIVPRVVLPIPLLTALPDACSCFWRPFQTKPSTRVTNRPLLPHQQNPKNKRAAFAARFRILLMHFESVAERTRRSIGKDLTAARRTDCGTRLLRGS